MTRDPVSEAERRRRRGDLWVWCMGVLTGINTWLTMEFLLRH